MILLQAQSGAGGAWSQLILMGGIMVVFFVFMILPQIRRQKKEKEFRDNLKKGDRVVTIAGIHGKIVTLDDDGSALLEVDEGVKLRMERAAIARHVGQKESEAKK